MGFWKKFLSTDALFPKVDTALLKGKTVVGVAESPTISQTVKLLFKQYECNAEMHHSAQLAINSLSSVSPDVVIIDSAVKDLPALDTCRLIRERCPNALLFLLTGIIARKPNAEEQKAGVTRIVEKPFDPRRLISAVADALQEKSQSGA